MSKSNTYYYKVANHIFVVCDERTAASEGLMSDNYTPFKMAQQSQPALTSGRAFTLHVVDEVEYDDFQQEVHQDDDGSEIIVGTVLCSEKEGMRLPCFKFLLSGELAGVMLTNADYTEGWLDSRHSLPSMFRFALDNALMVMYALSTATQMTALFHSSVIGCDGHAYMFLGKSGTGKSTHSRLWLKHIEGTELMNDDNPVVRIEDGVATVYGSPWSGKTPCYRNVSAPLGAIVQLSQAPYNKIRPLKSILAYAALVPSISGKRWDKRIAEGLHQTENWLAEHARVFHLECLPDADAARVCYEGVKS